MLTSAIFILEDLKRQLREINQKIEDKTLDLLDDNELFNYIGQIVVSSEDPTSDINRKDGESDNDYADRLRNSSSLLALLVKQNPTASTDSLKDILANSSISSLANNLLGLGAASAGSAAGNLNRAKITGNKWTQTFQNCSMGAAQLDEMYTSLATLNPAITTVSGNGTTVTVTVGTADIKSFIVGRSVTITAVDPVAYNITGNVASVNNAAGTFTITNAATGVYVSGGVASITTDRTITVTGNPGVATDTPSIATNKGWTVVG